MKKCYLGIGAGLAATAMLLSACTPPGGDSGEESAESLINVGWNEPFRSMNNSTANGAAVANSIVLYMMNDNFGYYDDELKVQDGTLGTVEEVSKDPLKIRYTFSDEANWSDGTPVDAADLVLQWAAKSSNFNTVDSNSDDEGNVRQNDDSTVYFDAARPGAALIKEFPEIAEDGKEVTFTYSKQYADWPLELGFGTEGVGVPAHITAKKALGEKDPAAGKKAVLDALRKKDVKGLSKISNVYNTGFDFTSMPKDQDLLVHNGPFAMTKYEEGQYLTLEKDENYTGPTKVGVDRATIRYVADPMAAVQGIENGELDVIQPQATADVRKAAEALDEVTVDTGDGASDEHIDLTFGNNGPFDAASYGGDEEKALKVRRAFLKTLPREQILDTIIKPLQDSSVVRNSFTQVPGSPMYDGVAAANGTDQYPGADTEAAKKLLSEAGVKPKVRLLYDETNERRQQQVTLIKEQADAAGFTIVEDGDPNWGSRMGDGTYDAALFAWQPTTKGVTDPDQNYRTGQQNNYGNYSNDSVDGLLDDLQSELEPSEQEKLLGKVEKQLIDDGFGMPLFQHPELTIYNDRVSGVKSTAVSPTMFWNYWDWKTE